MPPVKKNQPEIIPALREQIAQRMLDLGIDGPTALAARAGVTVQGLAPLRKGVRKKYQTRLTHNVSRALGWTPQSIERILEGGEPEIATPPAGTDSSDIHELIEMARNLHDRLLALEGRSGPTASPAPGEAPAPPRRR